MDPDLWYFIFLKTEIGISKQNILELGSFIRLRTHVLAELKNFTRDPFGNSLFSVKQDLKTI